MAFSKSKLVREYLDKFPDISHHGLARKLVNDLPEIFPTAENARARIRYCVGSSGSVHRKKVVNTKYMKEENLRKFFEFEDGEEVDSNFEPYVIPKNIERLGIISDEQFPFNDKYAILTALEHFKKRDVQGILFNGDTWDAYNVSSFVKDPRERSFSEELDQVRQYLTEVRNFFPGVDMWYKEGNHEERWERYLKVHAPVLMDSAEFQLDVLLQLRPKAINWIKNKITIVSISPKAPYSLPW